MSAWSSSGSAPCGVALILWKKPSSLASKVAAMFSDRGAPGVQATSAHASASSTNRGHEAAVRCCLRLVMTVRLRARHDASGGPMGKTARSIDVEFIQMQREGSGCEGRNRRIADGKIHHLAVAPR